jgi:RHS repeat-associated protein
MSSAQVATGTPAFNSYGGGPFDVVNLGNLNVNFTIPVLHKAGRGMPFAYDISFDNSIWTPVTSSGTTTWQPATAFGWHGLGIYQNGTITVSSQVFSAPCSPPLNMTPVYFTVYAPWVFHDVNGTAHTFGLATGTGTTQFGCVSYGPPTTGTGSANDGSGYTLSANVNTGTVYSASGRVLNVPINLPGGASTVTDANGNQITTSTGGTIVDTLGQTVLTIAGGAPNPLTFTYTPPSGTNVNYSVNYTSKNIKTNFGCSGVGEYAANGVSLVSSIGLPDGTSYSFTYEATPGYSGYYTGRVASVTLPTGGTITYTYDPSTDGHNGIICSDGSTDGLKRTINGGLWTYTRTLVSGSHWQTKVTTPPDPTVGDDTVIDFQKDSASSYPTYSFYETQRQAYQGSQAAGTLLLTTLSCWNGNTSSCTTTAISSPIGDNSSQPVFAKAVTLQYPGGLQSKTLSYYATDGLLGKVDQYAYGSGAPGSLAQETRIGYDSLLGNIVDHPLSVKVYDGNSNLLSWTNYGYDEYSTYPLQTTSGTPQHTSVTGSRGNATTITNYSKAAGGLTQHNSYYDTGNVYQTYDVNGATSTYNYDATAQGNSTKSCGNSFATSVNLPISGLSTSTTWNCIGGVATAVTDLNGNSISTSYTDSYFWRPASSQDPASNTTSFTYVTSPPSVDSRMLFNSSTSVAENLTTSGGFGQPLYTQQREGPSSTNYDSTQTIYDSFLRAYQSTMPCVTTSGTGCSSAAKTTTAFDALGRVTQITDGGTGYVSLAYTQNDILKVTGPAPSGENTKQKQLEYDALGRLTSVCEKTNMTGYGVCTQQTSSPNGYWTKYAYDTTTISSVLYTRITVTQNAQAASGSQQTRTYVSDLLGRLVQETNPENGTTNYTFDSDSAGTCTGTYNGDLVKRVDANGNTTCYTYDALHRVTSVSYSGTDSTRTPAKTFVYDGATFNSTAMSNPKGHLVEAYTGSSGSKVTDEFFSYSVRGELTDTYECTPHSGSSGCASVSNYYHVTAGYWANGALNTLNSNISGIPTQTYAVDPMGRTYSVTAGSGQNPVTSTTYDLANFKTTVNYGSSDSDVVNLDPNTGRMTKYTFNVGSNSDVGTATWNYNGSLASLAISDTVTSSADTQTCSYTHDDLARIASVNCLNGSTNKWNQNFTFDAFGNITKTTSGPGIAFQPTYGATSNWITALSGASPTTDSNGRMTNDGVHTYSWDAENKMYQVDSTTVTLDALGRMVEKAVGSTYTQIVYSPLGKKFAVMNGQTMQAAFVPLPSGAAAVYTSTGLTYYRHSDHLGSSRLATTPTRTLYSSTAYAPYGEPYTQAGTTDLSFTGQDQDTVSGMHDFRDRRHMPVQGRWLVPDTTGLSAVDVTNPQSWNRYAYVNNNPLAMIDPFGDDGCYSDPNLGSAVAQGGGGQKVSCDATYGGGPPINPFAPPGAIIGNGLKNFDPKGGPDSIGQENKISGDYMAQSYKNYVLWADALWTFWAYTYGGQTLKVPFEGKNVALTIGRGSDGAPAWTDAQGNTYSGDLPSFKIPSFDSGAFYPPFPAGVPGWVSTVAKTCADAGTAAKNAGKGSPPPPTLLQAVENCDHP